VAGTRDAVGFILCQFPHHLRSILHTVNKCLFLICNAQAAAEGEYGIVIVQREMAEIFLKLLKTVTDLRRVGFMGLCVSFVELLEDRFRLRITEI